MFVVSECEFFFYLLKGRMSVFIIFLCMKNVFINGTNGEARFMDIFSRYHPRFKG